MKFYPKYQEPDLDIKLSFNGSPFKFYSVFCKVIDYSKTRGMKESISIFGPEVIKCLEFFKTVLTNRPTISNITYQILLPCFEEMFMKTGEILTRNEDKTIEIIDEFITLIDRNMHYIGWSIPTTIQIAALISYMEKVVKAIELQYFRHI